MNAKSLVLLLVAGGCGLIASVAVTKHLSGKQTPQPQIDMENVVVAATDIEAGTKLTEDLLELKQFPAESVPEGYFDEIEDVVGEVLKVDVFEDEPILEQKLGPSLVGLSRRLPRGMRAATVRVDEEDARLAGLIHPGDHVDVIWIYTDMETGDTIIKTLLQDIEVLAVGQETDAALGDDDDEEYDGSEAERNYTLLVTPEQNNVLALASSRGKIRLSLRGKEDDAIVSDSEVRLSSLLPNAEQEQELPVPEPELPEEEIVVEYIKKGEIIRQPYKLRP